MKTRQLAISLFILVKFVCSPSARRNAYDSEFMWCKVSVYFWNGTNPLQSGIVSSIP